MSYKKVVILTGFIILNIIATLTVFAEEPNAAPAQDINQTQWAWGEVTVLDAQGKTITLKYLDYETDQEKDLVLAVDEKTNFENIASLNEIKVKDTLSVDYITASDGSNTARNINFEKPSSQATAVVPVADISAQEPAPEEMIPAAVTTEPSVPVTEAMQPEPASMPEIQSEDQVQ